MIRKEKTKEIGKNERRKYGWNLLRQFPPTYSYVYQRRLFPSGLLSFLLECGVLTMECHIPCHGYRHHRCDCNFYVSPYILPEKRIWTLRRTLLFARVSIRCRLFLPPSLSFFLPLSFSLFELKSRYSKITETGFRDYLVAGTEKTMETSGDCVRETRRRPARQLSVPGTRNVRVEGNEFSRFCWWPVFSVARLEKTGPRTTRKLFTAHLSRPRSRCTQPRTGRELRKSDATTSKYVYRCTCSVTLGDFA